MAGHVRRTLGDLTGWAFGQIFLQVAAGERYPIDIMSSRHNLLLDRNAHAEAVG